MNHRVKAIGRSAMLLGGLLLSVTACRADAVTATAGTASPPAAASSAAPSGEPGPVGAGTGGPGTLTVDITTPVTVAGHVTTPVSCQDSGRRYVESATGTVNGATVSQSVRVAGFNGPGTYPAVVTVSVAATDKGRYALDAVPTSVEITSAGGSVSFSAGTAEGRTLAGSIVWSCSA